MKEKFYNDSISETPWRIVVSEQSSNYDFLLNRSVEGVTSITARNNLPDPEESLKQLLIETANEMGYSEFIGNLYITVD